MKYRNVKEFFQAFFNFKTSGCTDVFQINTTESRSDIYNGFDDFFRILCIKTDRYSVDTAEFFEKYCFSFHNRHCSKSTDVTKSEYGTSVGNNSYSVGFHCISIGSLRIPGDHLTRFRNTRSVSNCQIFS